MQALFKLSKNFFLYKKITTLITTLTYIYYYILILLYRILIYWFKNSNFTMENNMIECNIKNKKHFNWFRQTVTFIA